MSATGVVLWRAIMRSSRMFDRQKHYRVLLSAPRDRAYDLISASWMKGEDDSAAAVPPADDPLECVDDLCLLDTDDSDDEGEG